MKCPRCENDNPEGTRFCGRCGRELAGPGDTVAVGTATFQTPSRGLDRGTTFARRFEIIEEIGKGGMGTVYKAFDNKIKEVVALKLLKPEIASDLEIIERFRNELKLARQVSHRHVCRMYDLGEEGLSIFISMEYVPGEDLKSFIRRSGHLNETKAIGLARQILEGLAEAHRLGVIHRDLKPQNIMIDRDGNAKIMDFGIARSLHTKGVTGTGVIIGTPEYMAPEQAEGRGIDHRVDIYALGAILFEMVTGRVPFEGETPLSIVLKHRSEPPTDPQTLNAQVSPELSRVILKCLEKSPERRYQSAAEALEAVVAIEKGLPAPSPTVVRAKPLTAREITVKFSLKKILIPALIVGALVIIGLVSLIHKGGTGDETGQAMRVTVKENMPVRGTQAPSEKGLPNPPPAPAEGTFRGGGPGGGSASGMLGFLAPMLKDPTKYMSEKDAKEFDKVIETLKTQYPKEAAAFSNYIDNIQGRMRQAHEERQAGKVEASKKSYDRGESEMRKLLAQVSERDRAEKAFQDLQDIKQKIGASGLKDRPNLLRWIASEKEKDASDAFAKNDFSGARILCTLLAKVYSLSLEVQGEADGLAALKAMTTVIRKEAETAEAPRKQTWLYERAVAEEDAAAERIKDGLVPQAAEQYILASFLFEKAKEVALESAQAGRN
jgi:tRNA A-37 threonylcarbamoyl transferase component Bud32